MNFNWANLGIFLPAELKRFPILNRQYDCKRDIIISLKEYGIEYIHFRVLILGKIVKAGGNFSLPKGLLNLKAENVEQSLGGIDWFLVPLKTKTLIFIIHGDKEIKIPAPPRNMFCRLSEENLLNIHISYLE